MRSRVKLAVIPTAVVASFSLATAEPLLPNQQADQPLWGGTLTNAAIHHTGVVFPTSQSRADAVGWEVFDEFVYNPYTTFSYESRELNTGSDSRKVLQVYHEAALGPGETGSAVPTSLQAKIKLTAGAYGAYASWSFSQTATFGQATGKITFTAATGLVVLSKFILAWKAV